MSTRITIDLLDEASIRRAIRALNDYESHVLKSQTETLVRGVASDVAKHASDQAHVVTGRLKASPKVLRRRKTYYQVVIDPIDPGKKHFHYAQTEKSRGGDHDFTRGYKSVALVSLAKRKGNF